MGSLSIRAWVQERHAQLHMARWMLEFDDEDAEDEFVVYDDMRGLNEARFPLAIGTVFTLVYGVVDVLILDEVPLGLVLIRVAGAITFLAAGIVITRSIWVGRHLQTGLRRPAHRDAGGPGDADGPFGGLPAGVPAHLLHGHPAGRGRPAAAADARRDRDDGRVRRGVPHPPRCAGRRGHPRPQRRAHGRPGGDRPPHRLRPGESLRRTDYLRQREVEIEQARSEEPAAQRPAGHHRPPAAHRAGRDRRLRTQRQRALLRHRRLHPGLRGAQPGGAWCNCSTRCSASSTCCASSAGSRRSRPSGTPTWQSPACRSLTRTTPPRSPSLALDMQRTLNRLSPSWPSPVAMRIGIASGPVVAGVIGRRKFTYDLWGDTVNTASRMESHGRPHRIQVAEATYALLADRYAFSDPQTVDIKGKGPMTTYFLLGAS
ncbi:adenylate/guanylate cyclase domain-containing protein [Nocardioides convexus]|uniref:adenylate/guanylate cyclase domain-containing protein n=1 Tax=Nocardioides convexus TaxID=2712224 RepID=UPI0024183F52|nr:adenylate/guanylate cyclase domain-containing protein [Nocardioides convexus]